MADPLAAAVALHQQGHRAEAARQYVAILERDPSNAQAHYLLANLLLDAEQLPEARKQVEEAIRLTPANGAYHSLLGRILHSGGAHKEAEKAVSEALRLRPQEGETWALLGSIHQALGNPREALWAYDRASLFGERTLMVFTGRVRALLALEEKQEAWVATEEALLYFPDQGRLHNIRGMVLDTLGKSDEALEAFFKAAELDPTDAVALQNAGAVLSQRNCLEEARRCLVDAYKRNPGHPLTLIRLAHVLQKEEKLPVAVPLYERAMASGVEDKTAILGRTHCILKIATKEAKGKGWNLDDAHEAAVEACSKVPGESFSWSARAEVAIRALQLPSAVEHFSKALEHGSYGDIYMGSFLFHTNYSHEMPNARRAEIARNWGDHLLKSTEALRYSHQSKGSPEKRLRIGYVSADFNYHPVSYFLFPVMETHDREKYEIYCYSNRSVPKEDDYSRKIQGLDVRWRNIWEVNDEAVAELVREDGIDILVDLSGHTTHNRMRVFAQKPAPIQVTWMGYPGSTGLTAIDYRFSDPITEPEGEADRLSAEQIVRLPHGFHVYRPYYNFPAVQELPCLKRGWFTFGSFNNCKKITGEVVRVWARILKAMPNAQLVLKDRNLSIHENRRRVHGLFAAHGIPASRVQLVGLLKNNAAHLAGYGNIDVALDPFPYNGTTTTCEALVMGVPVVTLMGDNHASRVTASLVTHAGFPEWVAADEDAYVRLACDLASDVTTLAETRRNLRARMENSPLCDIPRFTREIEEAYRWMWRRWLGETTASAPFATTATPVHQLETV